MVQETAAHMVVQSLGTATQGAPTDLLIVSSEGSIRDLESLRRRREQLTDVGLLLIPITSMARLADRKLPYS